MPRSGVRVPFPADGTEDDIFGLFCIKNMVDKAAVSSRK